MQENVRGTIVEERKKECLRSVNRNSAKAGETVKR